MRYYSIVLTNPDSGAVLQPASGSIDPNATYTSFANGQTIPGALNVELDIPVSTFDTPDGSAFVRVWGVSLSEIAQSTDLRGMGIKVFAGMQKGLPLAKPAQAGLILAGFVNQAFGNWIGTDQTLDLIVAPGTGTIVAPKNIIHNWKKGTPLKDAIQSTLSTAFPSYTAKINISDKLVLTEDDIGYFATIEQYASQIIDMSKAIVNDPNYPGVRISITETTFTVFDGTSPTSPQMIAFEDMIGQPTWIDPLTVQFKCVMRADLHIADYIKFPPAITTTTNQGAVPAGSTLKQSSVFQGTFLINKERHFGNFRQPDAASWATTFNCVSTTAGS